MSRFQSVSLRFFSEDDLDLRRKGRRVTHGRSLTIKVAKSIVVLVFSVYLVVVGVSGYLRLRADNAHLATQARLFASDYASVISSRMFSRFDELAFIGGSISLGEVETGRLSSPVEHAISAFLHETPDLGVVNVLDASGSKVIWSTANDPSSLDITPNSRHFPWSSGDRMLVGIPVYSKRFGRFIVSTRYAILVNGKPQFYVGAPFYLGDLLDQNVNKLPFQLYVSFPKLEASQFQVVGEGSIKEAKRLPNSSFLGISLSRSIAVPSSPWKVVVSWSNSEIVSLWLHGLSFVLLLYGLGLSVISFFSVALLRRAEKDRLLLGFERSKAQLDLVGMSFDGTLDSVAAKMLEAVGEIEVIECASVATENCDGSWKQFALYGPDITKCYPEVLKSRPFKETGDVPRNGQFESAPTSWRSLPKRLCVQGGASHSLGRSGVRVMLREFELRVSDSSDSYLLCIAVRRNSRLQGSCDKEIIELSMSLEQNLRLFQSNARSRYLETMYKALSSVGEVALGAKTESDVLSGSTSALVRYPFFVSAGVVTFDESDRPRLLSVDGGGGTEVISLIQKDPSLLAPTLLRSVWRSRESSTDDFLLRNPSKNAFWDICERFDWQSSLVLPIDVSGVRFAVMFIVANESAVFHGEMLELCQRLARLIGRGIAEIRLKISLDQSLERESLLARVDPLTGLPNRLELDQKLTEIFRSSAVDTTRFVVGVIDLDNFKPINDTFGHLCGDDVLREFARRLKGSLRPCDFVARLGGDEFVVVLEVDSSLESLDALLARLEVTYAKAFALGPDGHYAYLQITLGVALYPDDGVNPDVLIRRADAALYRSKANKIRRSSWWERWKEDDLSVSEASCQTDSDSLNSVGLAALYSNATSVLPAVEHAAIDIIATVGRSLDDGHRIGHFSAYGYRSLTDLILSYLGIVVGGVDLGMERERLERDLGNIFAYIGVSFPDVIRLIDRLDVAVSHSLANLDLQIGSQRDVMESLDFILRQSFRIQFETTRSTIATCRQVISDLGVVEGVLWREALSACFQKLLLIPGVNSLGVLYMGAEGELHVDESTVGTSLDYQSLVKLLGRSSHGADQTNLLNDSWRSLTISTTNFEIGYLTDVRVGESQVRSVAAIPIYDSAMRPVSLLVVTGDYLDMFDAPLGRQLLLAIQHYLSTLNQTLSSSSSSGEAITNLRGWRNALYSGGLQMFFQPIVDLKTGELKEVEGLARLMLPDGSIVGPNLFIPAFSDRELEYLLKNGTERAMSDVATLSEVVGEISLSINIHPKSLTQRGLIAWLKDILQDSAMDAVRLKLELLESDELLNSPQIQEILGEIRALGVRLAMDDFGSGHSNIARLREIEFNGVKIDQLVLRGVYDDPLRVLDLLGMAVMLGRDLGLEVTVEGIEDLGSLEMAAHLGAHRGQGYVISRPMPESAFISWYDEFVPMRRSQSIRYALGALATHWRFMHTNITLMSDESLCPIQIFIESKKLLSSPLGEFHRAFHVAVEEQDRFAVTSFSKSMMRELARLCVEESSIYKSLV